MVKDNALLPYGKLAMCKIFNIKSEMLLFHSECFITKVRTQQVVISYFFHKNVNQILFHCSTGVKIYAEVKIMCCK